MAETINTEKQNIEIQKEEEKEKMEITNNLAELDQMSAKELVEAAQKGIHAGMSVSIIGK